MYMYPDRLRIVLLRTAYGASRMATRDFATHQVRVRSLAIASSVGESIVQHARVRSRATWPGAAGARHSWRLHAEPRPTPHGRRLRMFLERRPRPGDDVQARAPKSRPASDYGVDAATYM